jgi:von Willebrand factor type A domain
MSKIDLATVVLSLSVAGCSFSQGNAGVSSSGAGVNGAASGRGGSSGSFGSGTGSGGDVGLTGSAGSAGGCGQMNVPIAPLPPDILIVQDRSSSMKNDDSDSSCRGGCGANSKWSQVTAALTQVVTNTQASINWGLKLFSDNGACDASSAPVVAVGAGNGPAISTAIAAATPGGNTPTRDAITNGAAYLSGLTDKNDKYILLATDGLPNCPDGCSGMAQPSTSCIMTDNPSEDTVAEQAILTAGQMGFKTFVIGIGDVTVAVATLNQMAVNGGEPQVGASTSYYAATDPTALQNALNAIVGVVASCTISLTGAPAGFTNVAISADSGGNTIEIPADPTNGWSYGPSMQTVILNGTACSDLKDGTYTNLQFYYACGGTTIHIGAVVAR